MILIECLTLWNLWFSTINTTKFTLFKSINLLYWIDTQLFNTYFISNTFNTSLIIIKSINLLEIDNFKLDWLAMMLIECLTTLTTNRRTFCCAFTSTWQVTKPKTSARPDIAFRTSDSPWPSSSRASVAPAAPPPNRCPSLRFVHIHFINILTPKKSSFWLHFEHETQHKGFFSFISSTF